MFLIFNTYSVFCQVRYHQPMDQLYMPSQKTQKMLLFDFLLVLMMDHKIEEQQMPLNTKTNNASCIWNEEKNQLN